MLIFKEDDDKKLQVTNPDDPICIVELMDITDISAGHDHLLALDKHGRLFAMGDDTYGQCGTGPLD